MKTLLVASWAAVIAAALVLAAPFALADTDGQTCTASTENPLTSLDYSSPAVEACVRTRCVATLGTEPSVFTGGYCGGDAASEASVPCTQLFDAYNAYYSCVMRALQGSTVEALATVVSQVEVFMNTPGYPYHLSPLGCYACNHFRETVFPAIGTTCSSWTCKSISSQSAASSWYGQMGKGYNHQLCGTGCIAAMMLTIPFALISASMFIACGCCWPSPSLKTTYAAALAEEEAEKYRFRSDNEDDEDEDEDEDEDANREPVESVKRDVAHEPLESRNTGVVREPLEGGSVKAVQAPVGEGRNSGRPSDTYSDDYTNLH
ncbi:hypothetical protein ABL78_2797 [Leptomonas seymouri]|uniref:Uncharacterized protein n=1 Tax=Leptomonas seymouri TaxID=5684 RepID=A0A0N1HYT1_LEPSE|nr:hypothetical protein ABL78_2797 [Leptomonas seymouri]|eukprot:KPI88110.1 hypothetical protein ABL78_2797 [Leptomonas seymouri]